MCVCLLFPKSWKVKYCVAPSNLHVQNFMYGAVTALVPNRVVEAILLQSLRYNAFL